MMPRLRANGIEIEYQSFGRDADPAILFIMGFACPLTIWPDSFFQGLAATGHRAIRFDNRDIGRSTHLNGQIALSPSELIAKLAAGQPTTVAYGLEDMAADAAGLLDALGIARAHIVGMSMGGMIAQLVALNHPAKTRSLTSIMSTTGRRGLPQSKPEVMAALMTPPPSNAREDIIVTSLRARHAFAGTGFPESDTELRARVERDVDYAPYDPVGIARQMAAIIVAQPRHERLRALKVPALVIHGADDALLLPDHGKDTADSIPGAAWELIPGMGHGCNEALTPVLVKRIGDFIAKVDARGESRPIPRPAP
jgi:pimeloyl-ACP methyl ester carboxylesterase